MAQNPDKEGTRTDRLFAMILLLQQRPSMTSRDLAEYFGVSRRTIFRDLRSLTDSGVPLAYSEGGGYEILEGYQLPPLMVTAREAATLLVGTEFMKLQGETALGRDAEEVALKIKAVLPREVKDFVSTLLDRTVLDPFWTQAVAHEAEETERWHKVSEAVARGQRVVMEYWVESRKELTKRRVDPLGLVYYTDHWNLIAFDHLRSEVRNFRLDRAKSLFVLSERFTWPEGFDLPAYLLERGMGADAPQITVDVARNVLRRFEAELPARLERENASLPPEPADEGRDPVRVTFQFDNLDYMAAWLLRFSADVTIISPDALIDRLRSALSAIASKYE
ncbi:MAG: DNA-binding transcriptional regulator [Bacteroidetes bacterium CG12_big_fil_rev_8_21_14_0_65_60_17]|nr:MAG: DNA-binding transcriptional regulator [Bacteroidetes bacterium CG12_big_fil_rev_8_21_14_0_65_60_17]